MKLLPLFFFGMLFLIVAAINAIDDMHHQRELSQRMAELEIRVERLEIGCACRTN